MICGVVFLDEEAGGGLELLGILLFVYGDFPDRSEALFFSFHGDGNGVPRSAALVLLPKPNAREPARY